LTQLGTQRSSGVPGASLNSLYTVVRPRSHDGHLTAILRLGLLMSVADSSPRAMQIVGPSGLLHSLASMRFYVFRFVGRAFLTYHPVLISMFCGQKHVRSQSYGDPGLHD
jgi:hypothetical protein